MEKKESAEKAVRDIRRKTRRRFSAEEKIRIVIEGLRGEESIASLCRREGIAANLYYLNEYVVGRRANPLGPEWRLDDDAFVWVLVGRQPCERYFSGFSLS